MKLIERISREKDGYTKTERRIADYMLDYPLEFAVSSIGSMAERLNMSKTSLIRFSKRLGFEGYQELRKQLQEEEVKCASPTERFQRLVDVKHNSIAELAEVEIGNLRHCLEHLDGEVLDRFVSCMVSSRLVYTAGAGMASFAAEIMGCRMKQLGFPFLFLNLGRAGLATELMYAQPEDLLILFDFPDYQLQLTEGAAYAKKRGLTVALVTDYVTCPLTKYADMVLYCDPQTDLFKNSLTAPVFLVNVLMSQAIYQDNGKMLAYLQKQEELNQLRREECKEVHGNDDN